LPWSRAQAPRSGQDRASTPLRRLPRARRWHVQVLQLPRPAPACAVCTMSSGRRLPRATAVAGAVGPIPCAQRQRSERKRAFSRRNARATGQNLTLGIRFHARRRADMGVRSAPPVDAREIEGSNGLQDLRTNRRCHGDRGQYSPRANGYDFMTSRSFTRSIRGWKGSLQIPIRVVSTI
jgi:hypothetical protein